MGSGGGQRMWPAAALDLLQKSFFNEKGQLPSPATFKTHEVYDHLAAHWGPNHTHPFDVLGVRLWCPVLQQKRLFAMPLGSQANIANEGVELQTSAKKITENDLPRLKEHVETIAREITANGQVSPPGCAVIFYNVLVQHAGVQTIEDEHTTSNTHEDKLVKIAREALGVGVGRRSERAGFEKGPFGVSRSS